MFVVLVTAVIEHFAVLEGVLEAVLEGALEHIRIGRTIFPKCVSGFDKVYKDNKEQYGFVCGKHKGHRES